MAENSKIEWTHHTFNPWRGCTKVSPGCKNCYAEDLSGRNPAVLGQWGLHGTRVVAADSAWRDPLKWDRKAAAAGERHRVFCASLADVFEGAETMPALAWHGVARARMRLVALIQNTPNLDWLLLTKRPQHVRPILEGLRDTTDLDMLGRTREFLRAWLDGSPPANVRVGTSVEDQKTADERLPHLMELDWPNFVSYEPALGPVDFGRLVAPRLYGTYLIDALRGTTRDHRGGRYEPGRRLRPIEWVICGGESGLNARPMHPAWAREVRDQCEAAGVPYLFKQWGEWLPGGQVNVDGNQVGGITWHDFGDGNHSLRVGKKRAGRNLDGALHDGFPDFAGVAR